MPALAIERRTPFGVRWRVVTDYVEWRREPRCYVRRCQQIRIWPHRGRARQREMKFDRSAPHTRAPLSSRSSSSPFFFHSCWLPSTFRVRTNVVSSISRALSLQNGVSRTSRVPHGHPTPPAFANALSLSLSPSPLLTGSWGRTPYFIQFSFICHFPAAGYAPSGRSSSGPP